MSNDDLFKIAEEFVRHVLLSAALRPVFVQAMEDLIRDPETPEIALARIERALLRARGGYEH